MANRRFIDFPIASSVGDSDIVLIWQDGMNKQTTKGTLIQGAPTSLEGLTDVDIAGLINGQILQYNSTSGKWENVDRTDIDLSELGDVSIVSPTNGQVLVYNSSTSKWENSSGGYVPYTGAVTTVDLGAQGLRAGYIRFDTSIVSVPDEQGLMYWDASKSTAALIMNGTLQHIGQDTFFYVKNSTGSSIPKGTAVRFDGTDGASGHLLIAPFLANGTYPSSYFMGVTAEAIDNGAFGQVMHFGELSGINTSGYSAGALLYASTSVAGGFQTTAPVAPNNIVLIAAAVNSKNNGEIIVRPQIGSNINNDEGVKITSGTTGDLLQLQAGGLWENKSVATVMSNYVTLDGTQTISGAKTFTSAAKFDAYIRLKHSIYLDHVSGYSTIGSDADNFFFATSSTKYAAFNLGNLTNQRVYTFPDAAGTIALTSDIPANPVGGTGTTNYLPKFTGTSTIGNSNVISQSTGLYVVGSEIFTTGNGGIFFNGNGSYATGIFGYNSSLNLRIVAPTQIELYTNNSQRAIIDASGNVGIGTSSPSFQLHINRAGNTGVFVSNTTGNTGGYLFAGGLSGLELQSVDSSNSTVQKLMLQHYGGNVLIGTTTDNGARLQVNGNTAITGGLRFTASGADANRWSVYWNGATGDLIVVNNISDIRAKKDFDYNIKGLETISKLKPLKFTWKDGTSHSTSVSGRVRQYGFIAQETMEADEYLAWYNQSQDTWGIEQYESFSAVMVKAIQELKQEIDTLKN